MKACKKLQEYRGTTETFTDKVRRDSACLMLPGPCPAVKHIWPRTRLRHARENVAAYLCGYPSKGLKGSSAPPRSDSESGPDRGAPPGQSQPQTLRQKPQHQGGSQHASSCPKCSTSTTFKSPKQPPIMSPPPPSLPCPFFFFIFPNFQIYFSLVASHMVSDWRESHQVPVFEAQLCT